MYRSFYQKRIKATILFATETGRARNYANVVKDVFGRVFAAKVCCMEDYDKTNMENEQLLIIVTSTFGSGDPPANGEVRMKDAVNLTCMMEISTYLSLILLHFVLSLQISCQLGRDTVR